MARLTASVPADLLARIHLDDDRGVAVADATGTLEIDVPPGGYHLRAVARGRLTVERVVVDDDEPLVRRLDLGAPTSAAPILGSTAFDPDHADLLDAALRGTGAEGAFLVVLVRHVDGSGASPAADVTVEAGTRVMPLRWTEAAGVRCASAALPPGVHVARVGGRPTTALAVPLWQGWTTILVVPVVAGRPMAEHAALQCMPVGVGWADGQAMADRTEQLAGGLRDGLDQAVLAAAVAGETPLDHLLRGDRDRLLSFDPTGAVARADLAALGVRAGDLAGGAVDEVPVLAASAAVLLEHEARHPWSLGPRLSAAYTSRLASSLLFRWRPGSALPLPEAAPERWSDDVRRFTTRRLPDDRRIRALAAGSPALGPAGRRLLTHVADRSYARRVPAAQVVHDDVGDLVLTTGLPAVALQAGLAEGGTGIRRWRRRRIAAAVAAVALLGGAAWLLLSGGDARGWPADDALELDEDASGSIDPLANDESERPLRLVSVGSAANGTAVVEGARVIYTPSPDFNGTDSFTYLADDGTEQAEGTVEVTVRPVNDAPVAADDVGAVAVGAAVEVDVLANDTDVDGDDLVVTAVDDPTGQARVEDGRVTFTALVPRPAAFVYQVSDGNGGTAQARVLVQVERGGPTTAAADDTVETAVATPVDVDVTANDRGVTGEIEVVVVEPPSSGEVQVDGRIVRYTPAGEFAGTDRFTYRLEGGGSTSNEATVTVRVLPAIQISDVTTAEAPTNEPYDLIMQVKLTNASAEPVTVAFATVEGTASEDADYERAAGVLTFEPGQTVAEVSIRILGDDGADDAEETFEVRLSDATNAFVDREAGAGTVTIINRVVVD